MESIVAIAVGVVAALLVIGGVAAVAVMNVDAGDSTGVGHVMAKVKEKLTGASSSDDSSGESSVVEKVGSVVKDEIVESGQNPGTSYREVTYSDGGIRQYDTSTGELVGSSYSSDQDKLPSME